MKRITIASAILASMFTLALMHSFHITRYTRQLTSLLEEAENCAESGQWEKAGETCRRAHQLWDNKAVYLHVLFRHEDTDAIYTSFHEVEEFLQCQEEGEYSAANARLIVQLELLAEAEQPSLKNIL